MELDSCSFSKLSSQKASRIGTVRPPEVIPFSSSLATNQSSKLE
jgi:hypothetical protein